MTEADGILSRQSYSRNKNRKLKTPGFALVLPVGSIGLSQAALTDRNRANSLVLQFTR